MCMSILSEHWAPKCSGTCCLSIMLTLLSTKLWNDGELWLLKKLILYLWIQCQDSFIFQAATNGLDYNSPGSRVYHQGLWSESTSCKIWAYMQHTGCYINFTTKMIKYWPTFRHLAILMKGQLQIHPLCKFHSDIKILKFLLGLPHEGSVSSAGLVPA